MNRCKSMSGDIRNGTASILAIAHRNAWSDETAASGPSTSVVERRVPTPIAAVHTPREQSFRIGRAVDLDGQEDRTARL